MKCLWCGDPFELYDPGMYQFCDRCLANLETISVALNEAVKAILEGRTKLTRRNDKRTLKKGG
ncbi:MAG: hypothetical protein A2156_15420 [Deltaproteobacteria bacterium RBG_16_48_10]|nr:MAG: hypothetical protein A2156_15420 [Deltaproteobacteria bacterium RBG_16_48_10]